MEQEDFVDLIKEVVTQSAVDDTILLIEKPPGRQPKKELVELSFWYNGLEQDDKNKIKRIVKMASHITAFGFFCVLDGVRPLKRVLGEQEPEIKLLYNGKQLNDSKMDFLHDLYNSED